MDFQMSSIFDCFSYSAALVRLKKLRAEKTKELAVMLNDCTKSQATLDISNQVCKTKELAVMLNDCTKSQAIWTF